MGLISYVSRKRRELIERQAVPHLTGGEEVAHWVRCSKVNERGEGFAYLTPKRLIISWTGKEDGHCVAKWSEITTWGLANDVKGGPILGVQVDGETWYAQIQATTRNMAEVARRFIQEVDKLAPETTKKFVGGVGLGTFETEGDVEVDQVRKTPAEMAKRIAITIVGVTLIIAAALIIPLPGPWSFFVVIAGLAILSSEYDWAKDLLEWTKERFQKVREKMGQRKRSSRLNN